MSELDRHIRSALSHGHFEFCDPIAFRFVRVGNLELCKNYLDRWYLPTSLPGGVKLDWLTCLYLDLVRVAYMKRARAAA